MKILLLAVAGLGTVITIGSYMNRANTRGMPAMETVVEPNREQTMEQTQPLSAFALKREPSPNPADTINPNHPDALRGRESKQGTLASIGAPDSRLGFDQDVQTLVSPQAGFEQKQAIWKSFKKTGKLDQAISELEARAANDPGTAEYSSALGQAYLKKCGVIEDVREQAILAMKADQSLEAALNLDPLNWEARFTKAVGMSYWPPQLNKGQEVIEQFQILIQQQEAQPAQPQFARSYLSLGDQYQKAGHAEYAAQVWGRGAALFPDNKELANKLASAQSQR